MKRKNQIIKRTSAFLCACFVALGCLLSVPVYAATVGNADVEIWVKNNKVGDLLYNGDISVTLPPQVEDYKNYYILYSPKEGTFGLYLTNGNLYIGGYNDSYDTSSDKTYSVSIYNPDPYDIYVSSDCCNWEKFKVDGVEYETSVEFSDWGNGVSWWNKNYPSGDFVLWRRYYRIVCNSSDFLGRYSKELIVPTRIIGDRYNSSIGYLQNVTRKSTYIRDALYNYDEDSLTIHWTHDLMSSTGVDLSGGNYSIRHYISKATVEGYGKEDIIEMSDKYLVGEYDASSGGFSYLKKDYDDKIIELGYENIDWIDKYLRGYFVLEHNYFQIVNTDTNEVGGYLHFYPKDANGDSFGVEYEFEGLDKDFEVDEDAPSGFIDNQTGSGLTHEDALENAEQPKLDDLSGVDELTTNLDAYAEQIGGVTSGLGALFGALPPWIVGLLGLSVALSFAVVVFKVLRG